MHTVSNAVDVNLPIVYGEVPEDASLWFSGDIHKGKRRLYTVTQAERYIYYCRYHTAEGIIGTVTVMDRAPRSAWSLRNSGP